MKRFGSRKFLLALLVVLIASALCACGLIDGGQWVTAVGGALAVHASGNVAQKVWAKETTDGME